MTHVYKVDGMTCMGCVGSVKKALSKITGVEDVHINLEDGFTKITSNTPLPIEALSRTLGEIGTYSIQEFPPKPQDTSKQEEVKKSQRLFPLFLVFAYLTGMVLLSQLLAGAWNTQNAMQNFMGGFFLIFSFFKMLDLKGFAYAFSTYDPLAKRSLGYAYLYPFIEVILGVLFLTGIQLFWANILTLSLLLIGSIGVVDSVLNKRDIQCACLGTVFNLPMTQVTLIENSLMIVMSGLMISKFL